MYGMSTPILQYMHVQKKEKDISVKHNCLTRMYVHIQILAAQCARLYNDDDDNDDADNDEDDHVVRVLWEYPYVGRK